MNLVARADTSSAAKDDESYTYALTILRLEHELAEIQACVLLVVIAPIIHPSSLCPLMLLRLHALCIVLIMQYEPGGKHSSRR